MFASLRVRLAAIAGGLCAAGALAAPLAELAVRSNGISSYPAAAELPIGVGLGLAALAGAAVWVLAGHLLRPVAELSQAARRLEAGEAARVTVETKDELGRLAEGFNRMAETLAERERRISRLALRDAQTGLPNRLALERRLDQLQGSGAEGVTAAVVSVDRLARLRSVIGDELVGALVKDLTERIAARAPTAMIGRLSPEGLGVIFQDQGPDVMRRAGAVLEAALAAPLSIGGTTLPVSATIGLAQGPQGGGALRPILARAAIAADQARARRQKLAVFDARAYGDPAANLGLMGEMLRSIERGELVIYHQPKVDMRGGGVAGVEALARWRHPKRGLLSPDMFIPLAEETGHIRPLTDCVLRQAIEHQAAMRLAGHDVDVSVNISGRLLSDADFAEAALKLAAGAEGKLRFEVTETAVIDEPERALRHIERFVAAGVGVSIDDYGAGLSSLAYLKQIRAEELKIDQALVLGLTERGRDALLVRSTIDLGHSLGLKVTAEGVETPEAFAALAGMGCDFAQGFLIERPMPLGDVLRFLEEDRGWTRKRG
ncbi:MAG: GGDEF domain-containing protein [Caulobacteraceae bacterium]|nr:GGDEF domain-containing protein [Caulobacteraceae bacterium]